MITFSLVWHFQFRHWNYSRFCLKIGIFSSKLHYFAVKCSLLLRLEKDFRVKIWNHLQISSLKQRNNGLEQNNDQSLIDNFQQGGKFWPWNHFRCVEKHISQSPLRARRVWGGWNVFKEGAVWMLVESSTSYRHGETTFPVPVWAWKIFLKMNS